MIDDFVKTIVSGAIAYYLPKVLKATDPTEAQTPWPGWVIASFIGGAVGGTVSALLGNVGFGNWAAYGACLGLGQLLGLRKYLPVTGWWAVASTVSWALYPLGQIWAPILVGLSLGILQALTLKNVSGKGWWIGGNLIVWPLVTIIGMAIAGPIFGALGPILGWMVGWGLVGVIGAILLIYPLSQLKAE